jgi:hypothetical protein
MREDDSVEAINCRLFGSTERRYMRRHYKILLTVNRVSDLSLPWSANLVCCDLYGRRPVSRLQEL